MISIMTLSIAVQFIAAFLAIRMIPISGAYSAWIFLACGFILQALRRATSLVYLLDGRFRGDMSVELMGLAISILMSIGIWKFRPVFAEINRSHQALVSRRDELAELNSKLEEEAAARREAEISLRESEKRYSRLVNTANEGVWAIDAGHRTTYVNQRMADMLGYTVEELLGRNVEDFASPEDLPLLTTKLEQRRQGFSDQYECRVRQSNGVDIWLAVSATPLFDSDNRVYGAFAMCSDITKRKWAEQQFHALNVELEERVVERTSDLQRLNRELETFCYSISHELRAPLARIQGFSSMLTESAAKRDTEELVFVAERVGVASLRLRSVIDSLLLMNRLSRTDLLKERVNLSELVDTTVKELLAETAGRDIKVIIAPEVFVSGDRRMLSVCMQNLLGNAVKYTSKTAAAEVEFGCKDIAGEKICFVRDNGAGFNIEFADKLFEPFCRLHSEAEFEGSGMGLPTVQRIIERHGGRIWAEAEEGRGATFFFTLGTNTQ